MATLGTRRCRNNGDAERNGGLEGVEAGVGVTEVNERRKSSLLWETDGTLCLPAVANFVLFVETDGIGSCDGGDVDKFPTLRRFETEATRGLGAIVRLPGPVTEFGVPGSLVVGTFTLIDSLVTFEVIRTDDVGLG